MPKRMNDSFVPLSTDGTEPDSPEAPHALVSPLTSRASSPSSDLPEARESSILLPTAPTPLSSPRSPWRNWQLPQLSSFSLPPPPPWSDKPSIQPSDTDSRLRTFFAALHAVQRREALALRSEIPDSQDSPTEWPSSPPVLVKLEDEDQDEWLDSYYTQDPADKALARDAARMNTRSVTRSSSSAVNALDPAAALLESADIDASVNPSLPRISPPLTGRRTSGKNASKPTKSARPSPSTSASKDTAKRPVKQTKTSHAAKISKAGPKRSALGRSDRPRKVSKPPSNGSEASSIHEDEAPTAPAASSAAEGDLAVADVTGRFDQADVTPKATPQKKKSKEPLPPPPPAAVRCTFKAFYLQHEVYSALDVTTQGNWNGLKVNCRVGHVNCNEYSLKLGMRLVKVGRTVDVTVWYGRTKDSTRIEVLHEQDYPPWTQPIDQLLDYHVQQKASRLTVDVSDYYAPNLEMTLAQASAAITAATQAAAKAPPATPSSQPQGSDQTTPKGPSTKKKGRTPADEALREDAIEKQQLFEKIRVRWLCLDKQCSNVKAKDGVIGCYVLAGHHYELHGKIIEHWRNCILTGQGSVDDPAQSVVEMIINVDKARLQEKQKKKNRDRHEPVQQPPQPQYPPYPPYYPQPYGYPPPPPPYQAQQPQPQPHQRSSPPADEADVLEDANHVAYYCKWLKMSTPATTPLNKRIRQAINEAAERLGDGLWTLSMIKKEHEYPLGDAVPEPGLQRKMRNQIRAYLTWLEAHDPANLSDSDSAEGLGV